MKIAIIGAGNVGKALATSALRAGHSVTVSSSSGDSAATVARETGAKAAASNREAVEGAELVVIAVPYMAIVDLLDEVGPQLAGKIVVDATNPLKPDYSGLAVEGTSAAEGIQTHVPAARSAGRTDWNPNSGLISRIISRAPRLLVRNTRLFSKFTVELSPRRRTPLSSTPSSRRVMEGAAFSISSNSTRERLHFSLVTAFSFCCVSIGWVSRWPR